VLIEPLGLERARLVSLCGAGGKTTLMLALAREMAARGERVLVTTTTRIAAAEGEGPWPPGVFISHRGKSADGRKLTGHAPGEVDKLKDEGRFDRLLVEADGSRRTPLKAPAAHEPVIPSTSDAVIVVAGLSALGLPLRTETVFRPEIWAALSGTEPGAPVSAESFARVALHEAGLAKGCPVGSRITLFLNQVHTAETRAAAATIARLIAASSSNPYAKIVSGRLLPSPEIEPISPTQAAGPPQQGASPQ
jgi:probable selenium-dependent hydroxylase accessory protein YqeC